MKKLYALFLIIVLGLQFLSKISTARNSDKKMFITLTPGDAAFVSVVIGIATAQKIDVKADSEERRLICNFNFICICKFHSMEFLPLHPLFIVKASPEIIAIKKFEGG